MRAITRYRGAALSCLFVAALLAGCARKEAANGALPSTPQRNIKVALVTPGPISDKGWNASAYQGLQRIQKELGARTSEPVQSQGPAEFVGTLRNLAQEGNQLIFAHGQEYDDAARQVAADFPKATFVVMGGRSSGPNLSPIQLQAEQATYLAGMLAAGMSKTNKVGLIGGSEIPIIRSAFQAFERGAKAVKPNIQVKPVFIGTETDAGKAKQEALALLDAGADVLMHNADDAGKGVFQAVQEKPGALVIGANADQSSLATSQNLGSFILDVPNAMVSVARAVQESKGQGKPFPAGLKQHAVYFQYNPRFKGTIPRDLKARIEKAKDDIIAGKIDPAGDRRPRARAPSANVPSKR